MTVTLYGIANCDTVRKARGWLQAMNIDYAFHDYKKSGIGEDKLRRWVARAGWEKILNRAGTTFRKLDEADKAGLDGDRAVRIMLAHNSAIKRPIIEYSGAAGDGLLVGFDEPGWSAALAGEAT